MKETKMFNVYGQLLDRVIQQIYVFEDHYLNNLIKVECEQLLQSYLKL